MAKLLCLWVVLIGIVVSGCSAPSQTIKGAPIQLSMVDQDTVKNSFTSSRRIAVLIGIDKFDDPEWASLVYPEKDALDMATVLNDPRYGNFDKVIALTRPYETTKEYILETINELKRQNTSPNDTVVLYISSHGTIARIQDGKLHQYVVVRDTRINHVTETAIDLEDLKYAFNRLKSRKKALIFAFCHSGQGKSRLDEDMTAELKQIKSTFFVKPIDTTSEATIVLAASAWGETAREDSVLENDIYTHFLIDGIKKHDRNGDGAVTITEAHDYAKEQTYYYTKGEQRPSMESVVLGVDPIILSGKIVRTGMPVVFDYSRRYEHMLVYVDGEKKGALPMGIAVKPGIHQIALKTGENTMPLYQEVIHVSEGDEIPLPVLLYGYDQGTTFRVGYQGFLNDEVDRSVAKPLMMYGLAYSNYSLFGPQLGVRADASYGQANQTLTVGSITTSADVTQTSYGMALLYRYASGGMSVYGGPRLGRIEIKRQLAVGELGSESDGSTTVGGIIGLHFRHKKNISFALESALNYANIELVNNNSSAYFYSVFGELSINF